MLKIPFWLQDAIALVLFIVLITIVQFNPPQDSFNQQQRIDAVISGMVEPMPQN